MNDNVPGLNAPMTSGQKWAMAGMVIAALLNIVAFLVVICL